MHQMLAHQPLLLMEKERIGKQCCKHGEKSQHMVGEEHRQNFLDQEKTGNTFKILRNEKEES